MSAGWRQPWSGRAARDWFSADGGFGISYRGRITAALMGFFVAPVLAFALWSFARIGNEARDDGDLLIRRTLRDAGGPAGQADYIDPPALARTMEDLGARLDADLWLYHGGRLVGTSAPVLGELSAVDPLLAPGVFRLLTLRDELETLAEERTAGRAVRVGYRVVLAGPPDESAILAAPQLLDDESLRQQQEDLALALLLVTAAGLAAAIALAGVTARTLARPVAALSEAARALGQGATPSPFPA